MYLLRSWFGFALPVDRRTYVMSGFGLMACKYLLEAGIAWRVSGSFYGPLDFLDPRMQERAQFFRGGGPKPSVGSGLATG